MAWLKNTTSVRPLRGRKYKVGDVVICPGETREVPDAVVKRLQE